MPELDLALPKTSAFVQDRLREMGIPFTTLVGGNCVVATVGSGEPCIMLRADMDGLPIREQSGEPFSSENGCMHACGHDMHATSLLGAASLLKAREGELKGTVKLLFQPGEETFNGARAAIEEGVLESPRVDAAVGMHVASQAPLGVLCYGSQTMASVFGFRITVKGKGGHGSTPEACVDPIAAAIKIHEALDSLMVREKSPYADATLTIGKFQAGEVGNVIPEQAVMEGTLRVFDEDQRTYLVQRIREVVPAVAAAYRATARLEVLTDVPTLSNDDGLVEECLGAMTEAVADLRPIGGLHAMGSEDFALVSKRVPSAYFMLGAMPDDGAEPYSHHTPQVRFNEGELAIAAACYAASAIRWLESRA